MAAMGVKRTLRLREANEPIKESAEVLVRGFTGQVGDRLSSLGEVPVDRHIEIARGPNDDPAHAVVGIDLDEEGRIVRYPRLLGERERSLQTLLPQGRHLLRRPICPMMKIEHMGLS